MSRQLRLSLRAKRGAPDRRSHDLVNFNNEE
jgi:hypothetical protein